MERFSHSKNETFFDFLSKKRFVLWFQISVEKDLWKSKIFTIERKANGVLLVRVHSRDSEGRDLPDAVLHFGQTIRSMKSGANSMIRIPRSLEFERNLTLILRNEKEPTIGIFF